MTRRRRRLNSPLVWGVVIGTVLVGLASYPIVNRTEPTVFGLPGFILAVCCGCFAELYYGQGVSVGCKIYYFTGNILFYGAIAACGSWLVQRSYARMATEPERVPECCICGFKWVMPTSPQCPECGNRSFASSWMTSMLTTTLCAHCGYDLRGNVTGTCPECGAPVGSDKP